MKFFNDKSFFTLLIFLFKKQKTKKKGFHCIIRLKIVIKHFDESNGSEFLKQNESGNLLWASLVQRRSFNDHSTQLTETTARITGNFAVII